MLEPSGYFDEAGIHSQSSIIVVAGYVARDRDWQWLEEKWTRVLREEGAAYYHTTDIEADPPRGIYKGWSRAEADHLTDRIVPIVERFKGRIYGVHILATAWYAAVPFVKKILPERPHDGPYLLLAKDCIEVVVDSQDKYFKEQIGFVFARNDYTNQLLAGYEIIKQVNPRSSLLGPLAIDEMPSNPMLQAADLVSWHYRHANEIRMGLLKAPLHRAVLKVLRPNGVFRYVPEDAFAAQVANLFQQHGGEWNQLVWAKIAKQEEQRLERAKRGEERRRGSRG